MTAQRVVVVELRPAAVAAAIVDMLTLTEQRVRLELGQRPLSDTVRIVWEVQLDQRWPDGLPVTIPWERTDPVPDDAERLVCRGYL